MILLLLMGLGAAGVKAQVRIGGDTVPNPAAVLDLNANNDATPAKNKGALALPRVSLSSTTAQLNGVVPINGMLVYNTNDGMTNGSGVGVYCWSNNEWIPQAPSLNLSGVVLDTVPASGSMPVFDGTKWVARPALRVYQWTQVQSVPANGTVQSPISYPSSCDRTNSWVISNTHGADVISAVGNSGLLASRSFWPAALTEMVWLMCLAPY